MTYLEGRNADMPCAEYFIEVSLASLLSIAAIWSSLKSSGILNILEVALSFTFHRNTESVGGVMLRQESHDKRLTA
jgi:hypothetical protein